MSGPALIILFLASMVYLFVTIVRFKMNPFFSMISAAIAIGVLAGMDLNELVNGITSGFGSICAGLGIVVAMGFLLGGMLSEAGATDSLADATLRTFGEKRASLAMNITGYIVSIPVFYGSAYVILNPILSTLSRKTKKPIQVYITALSVGLLTTHCMVIPTPGPLSVAGTLGVNFGWFILYSLIVSVPGALIGGWLYGEFLGKKLYKYEEPVGEAATQSVPAEKNDTKRAPAGLAIAIIALPLLLIVFGTLIPMWTSNPMAVSVCKFLTVGNGVISLIISVAFAGQLCAADHQELQRDGRNHAAAGCRRFVRCDHSGERHRQLLCDAAAELECAADRAGVPAVPADAFCARLRCRGYGYDFFHRCAAVRADGRERHRHGSCDLCGEHGLCDADRRGFLAGAEAQQPVL